MSGVRPLARVLNLGRGLPAAAATRLMHAAGAQTYEAVLPGHDSFPEQYPAMRYWSRDHQALPLEQVEAFLAHADVVFLGGEDDPDAPPSLYTAAALNARFPDLVVVEIAGYVQGFTGPTAATELLVQARMGFVFEQFADRPTAFAFGPATYGAAILAALGAWTALIQRLRDGQGQHVSVSLEQGLALFWQQLWLRAKNPDLEFETFAPRGVKHLIFECLDGEYIQVVLGVPQALAKLHAILRIAGEVDPNDRGAPSLARGADNYFADRTTLAPYFARRRRSDLIAALKAQSMPAEPVLAPGDCFDDGQILAAGLVSTAGGGEQFASAPLGITHRTAPLNPVVGPFPGMGPFPAVGPGPSPVADRDLCPGPLAGVRVLDLGNWVAGPFSSKLLADLGADVISIEPPTGLSNLTGLRNGWAANRGKRSLVVDLKTAEGNALVLDLVRTAHAVHHNFRLGVDSRLGLDEASLRAVNPGIVFLHTTAYGQDGPKAADSGFDMVMQALCGHEVRAGGVSNEPLWYRSPFVDYGTGGLGAVALAAGLFRSLAGAEGSAAHVSLLSTATFLRGEYVRTASGAVRGAPPLDPERLGTHPSSSLYQTSDGWMAVDARGVRMRRRLAQLLGHRTSASGADTGPGLPAAHMSADTYADPALRKLRGDVAGWFLGRTTAKCLQALQEADVWAVECAADTLAELLKDPANRRANLIIEARDARYGSITGCFGPLIGFSRWHPDPQNFRSAPAPDEHRGQILAELRGSRQELPDRQALSVRP
jgi:crotonobetainyl-CoA:carnitine CoA-transferase CaiB-like acyl-CoA transferase